LIAVVLGEPSGKDRTLRAASLLDHGFETTAWKAALGAPTLDTLPMDPAARPVHSVRESVVAWNCNARKPVKKVSHRKQNGTTARTNAAAKKTMERKQTAAGKSAATSVPASPAAKSPVQPTRQ
jgi:D-alanyl-D-alanine carboxypeptidase